MWVKFLRLRFPLSFLVCSLFGSPLPLPSIRRRIRYRFDRSLRDMFGRSEFVRPAEEAKCSIWLRRSLAPSKLWATGRGTLVGIRNRNNSTTIVSCWQIIRNRPITMGRRGSTAKNVVPNHAFRDLRHHTNQRKGYQFTVRLLLHRPGELATSVVCVCSDLLLR